MCIHQGKWPHSSALMYAVYYGHTEAAALLLARGASVDLQDVGFLFV